MHTAHPSKTIVVVAVVAVTAISSCAQVQLDATRYAGRTLGEWNCRVDSGDVGVQIETAAELRDIARRDPATVGAFIDALRTGDEDDRGAAVSVLGTIIAEDERVLGALHGALKDDSPFVSGEAADVLWAHAKGQAPDRQRLVGELKSSDPGVRLFAAVALGKTLHGVYFDTLTRYEGAPELGRALTDALSDPDRQVRRYAAKALNGMNGAGRFTATALLVAARDEYAPVRAEAIGALADASSEAPVTVPLFIAGLQDSSPDVRKASAEALYDLGPLAGDAVGALSVALGDADQFVRGWAARALGSIGPAAESAIPPLVRAMHSDDLELREDAVRALGSMSKQQEDGVALGPAAATAIARALEEALADPEPLCRLNAAMALAELGPAAAPATHALIETLGDVDAGVRQYSAEALGSIGPVADAAVPRLVEALRDEEKLVRKAAVQAVDSIAATHDEAASPLVAALDDDEDDVARAAAWCLARRGRPSYAVLMTALGGARTSRARANAALAVGWLAGRRQGTSSGFSDVPLGEEGFADGAEEARRPTRDETDTIVAALIEVMNDEDGRVRVAACGALGAIGRGSLPALGTFIEGLRDREGEVRRLAAWGLEGLGPAAMSAVPALVAAIRDEYPPVRPHAIMALGRIAPEATEFIPDLGRALADPQYGGYASRILTWKGARATATLVDVLKSGNTTARKWAATTLGNIGTEAKGAGAALLDALSDEDAQVRASAAAAVGNVRPDAVAAVPLLIEMLRKDEQDLRDCAVAALASYGPDASEAVPALMDALRRDGKEEVWSVVSALASIGVDGESARALAELDLSEMPYLELRVFQALVRYPDAALAYLRKYPALLSEAGATEEFLSRLLEHTEPSYAELKRAVIEDEHIPAGVLARLGDRSLLPRVKELMETAAPHKRTYLEACARALGELPDRVIEISEEQKGTFRPASAWPGTDKKRMSPGGGGHGDGYAEILITGHILMSDGSPAMDPRLYGTNDGMLLGERTRDPLPIAYESETGRFLLFTSVFAAYSMGTDQHEPGPYQTGSALVSIEARGARPLTVRIFDEMPEVRIVLGRAP